MTKLCYIAVFQKWGCFISKLRGTLLFDNFKREPEDMQNIVIMKGYNFCLDTFIFM